MEGRLALVIVEQKNFLVAELVAEKYWLYTLITYFDELEQNGVEYPKTHDIEQLIFVAKNNKIDLYLGEYIEEHSEMFSQWESKSRDILGYLIEEKWWVFERDVK